MTPHHLHALAAAWSLQAARRTLATLARNEAAQIAAERREAPSLLRSPVYGGTYGSGGHSDPTPAAVRLAERTERRNRWAEMEDRLRLKLRWLAGQFPTPEPPVGSLSRIRLAIEHLQPGTAAVVAKHLQDEDRWVREATGIGPVEAPLLGVDCPACGTRALVVQCAGPEQAWTVVCAGSRRDGHHNPCLCVGGGCPCGMDGAVEGVAHIWPRTAVLGAVGGQR